MLPAIAVLHPLHARHRESGTILATVAGTTAVAVGLAGSVNVDLRPAALFVLGMWWWTIGKLWAETGILPRTLGTLTAALGAIAIFGGVYSSFAVGISAISPRVPDLPLWSALHAALGVWMIALAWTLARTASDVPSR